MYVRAPDIQPDQGPLVWSKIPEFSMAYNGYSVVIPYVEYYLNSIMNDVRSKHCGNDAALKDTIGIFIKQEINHSRYHVRFNKRMFDAGFEGLQALVDKVVLDLKELRETRSLAFNAAYCTGFESIATFDAKYLYERCDEFFEGADPHGANLLLWHVAEEFEHRTVCHDALGAVTGNYFTRMHGLFYAFWHIGGAFMRAEAIVLAHYRKDMSAKERKASVRQSRLLFWRQLAYVAPRMLKILLPWYNPVNIQVPPRVKTALDFFRSQGPINNCVELRKPAASTAL
ncbi:metal-dependent hydrolase [Pseudomonas umsongensis]|uniref:metal-dependent hydrolase n=1 Tax=Pseudomonas umsongensis TaxID=198618 RepID=UPI00200A08EA|nr:metal-dependent hydrolase [Pseudomonas umsongensis]MCK8683297.1 metal-dependent hydrolase [Pseudomonas umsongensis]